MARRTALFMLALPLWLQRRLAGTPVIREGRHLDTQVQLLLRLGGAQNAKGWSGTPVQRARRQLETECDLLTATPPAPEHIESLQLQGPAGAIPARLYRPAGLGNRAPAVVFYHGGGWVLGNIDSHDTLCRQIACEVRCVVISVDYRLAPEHPFPAAPEDALAAFRAIAQRAESLDLDPSRLAIAGDSAGANLAAVVAQQTRRDPRRPCFQLLAYPATDLTMSFPSINTFRKGFLLQRSSMDWFLDHYLPAGQDRRDPLGSPLYGELSGLPPAMVQTAGFDPLCDEGEAYAQRMQAAGVRVVHRRYEGLVHGYLHLADCVKAARTPRDDLWAALQQAFSTASPMPAQESLMEPAAI